MDADEKLSTKRQKTVSFDPSNPLPEHDLPDSDVSMSCGSIGSVSKQRPVWVKDEAQNSCFRCNSAFSLLQRRVSYTVIGCRDVLLS